VSWNSSPYIQTFKLFSIFVGICLASFYLISSVLLPVVISFTLYALFEPATLYLVRHKLNHSLAISIVLVILLATSFIAIGFALPQLFEQIGLLQSKLPQIVAQLQSLLNGIGEEISAKFGAKLNFSQITASFLSQTASLGQTALIEVSNRLLSIVIIFLLVPFLTYYLLRDFKPFRNRLMNWLPNSSFELGWLIYHNVAEQLKTYTRGVMLQSLIMATVCSIGFSIIGLDIPILLGCITGILNLIPYIGPLIAIVLSLLVGAAMTPFDPSILYLSVLVVIIAQAIDNAVVIPAVIANSVNLHPVQVILGIIIFGSLFGTLGVILAIPAIAAAKIVYSNIYADILNDSRRLSR